MKKNYFKQIALVLFSGVALIGKSQVAFYTEDFNSGAPVGYSSSAEWLLDDNILPVSSGYPGASGSFHYSASNGSSGITEILTFNGVSTLAFTNVSIQWGAYKEASFPGPVVFEWSADGITWNAVAYTDVANDATWALIPAFALPAGAAGLPNLQLRWSYVSDNNGFYFSIDDVVLTGTIVKYFSKSSGNLEVFSSWGTNADGTGISPANFTAGTTTYNIVNNAAPTIGANWTVSGANSKVITGDGSFATNFTLPAGAAFTGSIDVTNSASLSIVNTNSSTFTFVTLSTGSTVDYAAAGTQTMVGRTYSNLRISGSGAKSYGSNITVNTGLDISAGILQMPNNAFRVFTLNGTLSGAGTFSGSVGSRLTIGGSGAVGTLNMTAGTQTLHTLSFNRTGGGSMILGNSLFINNNLSHANGILDLNGMQLTINNAATFPTSASNGGFRGSATSSVSVINTGAINNSLFMDQTSSTTRALGTVLLNRGQTLTLGNAIDIHESITPSTGTVATGGFLTLKSNASTKGRIGIIGGTGALTGNATVEVFKPAGKTGWTNLAAGGVTGKTFADWNASFVITCPSGCPDGTGAGGVAFTSVYEYDETLGSPANSADPLHYVELAGTTTALNSYKGYWVYLGNGTPNTTAITIPLTGGVNTKNSGGNFTLTRTGATAGPETGWNLISNPYPSPILVSQVIASAGASNIDNTFYAYDPDTDSHTLFTATGSNSIIPMGQAFQVRAISTPVTVTPAETWKTTTNSNVSIEKTSAASTYAFNDFLLDLKSSAAPAGFSTQAYFAFGSGNTIGFDNGNDAYYIAAAVDPNSPVIYSISNNETFIKNALPTINGVVSVPVKVQTGYAGTYSINPVNINMLPAGACVALYDIAKNITHDLKTGPYTTTIAAGASTPQFELKITVNQTSITSNIVDPTCANAANGSIKAQGTTGGPWNYTWKNSSNSIIKTALNKATADTLKNVAQGTYFVDVHTVGSCDNANATFNLQSTTPGATALFTANTNTVDASSNVPVSFTNNSSNAVSYSWNFGDGSPLETTPNTTHVFNTAGTYNVVLTATGPCGDISTASTQINALLVSGIVDNTISQSNIFVSKDENGVFVQLNFDQMTSADINVTNVLGQIIINKKQVTGDKTKLYLMIPENEKVLFVTVIANGQKVTKKLIN